MKCGRLARANGAPKLSVVETSGEGVFESATATDTAGRTAQDSLTVNLPATNTFSYDWNGNLTNDGRRVFEYDFENQLTNVYVASTWRSEFKYDAFGGGGCGRNTVGKAAPGC